MSECSLPKIERLKSTKIIQRLFADGLSLSVYPIRVVYSYQEKIAQRDSSLPKPIKVAFSVGKRKYPKAVDRIRLKRQLREAYRTQKSILQDTLPTDSNFYLAVLFLYVGKEPVSFKRIKGAMKKNLKKLSACNFPDNQPIG